MANIVVLGELCEDILMHNPASVEVMGKKTWAKDITVNPGGSIFYTGAALKALGASVSVCSVVGDDPVGETMVHVLEDIGLDCSLIKTLPGAKTTRSIVVCDGAQKNFIGCSPMLPLQIPQWDDIKDADLFYIAGYTLYPELWTDEMVFLCRKAKEHGIIIAMDSQYLPIKDHNLSEMSKLSQILPLVDLFFAARKDARGLFGQDDPQKCRQVMEDMGFAGVLLLKRGSEGCYVIGGASATHILAFQVSAYDSVGAGDVFGGSFCWSWLQRRDPVKNAQFASACTALSICEYSERKHFPSAAEAEMFLIKTLGSW